MRDQFFLRRRALAGGACLLALGLLMASLVWVVSPSLPPAGAASSAGGEAARSLARAEVGGHSAPLAPRDAKRAVREAWEQARDAGAYTFATNLTQVTYPARSLANAGRGPQRDELHLAGTIDQPARTLEFQMWQPGIDGAGAMAPGSAAEARVEGDRAYVRQAGGEWQEVQDFSASFAPDNDLLAFLGGIKDVADCGLQARAATPDSADLAGARVVNSEPRSAAGSLVACYRFTMDGPTLATYLRDRLERQLAERGELPLGVTLQASAEFREMTGDGELWVDGRGLPLRLVMHLAFPEERDGSRLEADIQTHFSGFPQETAALPDFAQDPVAWTGAMLGLDDPSLPARAAQTAGTGGVLVLSLVTTAWLFSHRRSRRLYAAVVIAVILSMVVVPLLQSGRVVAFFERQEARAQDLLSLDTEAQVLDAQRAGEAEAAQQAIADALSPSWNPHDDPLAEPAQTVPQAGGLDAAPAGDTVLARAPGSEFAVDAQPDPPAPLAVTVLGAVQEAPVCPDDTADPDDDGVSNHDECEYSLLPDDADSDDDGLTDGQELHELGTDGNNPDTDGDVITDTVEVEGFWYNGMQWYLDPKNPDTNNDGVIDSAECPALVDVANPDETTIRDQCDTDEDGIPNPFDTDNDDDGVPDRIDLSPDQWVDVMGLRSDPVADATPFNRDTPFLLTLEHLQAGWPVLVDLQMRPENPAHLGYAMNVLDWPAGDVAGQIQHQADTTFATSNNDDVRNPDDLAGSNGDMRLVPLLEIVMTGAQIPLKLTEPAITATVGNGTALSSTVALRPGSNPDDTQFTFTYHAGTSLKVYEGTCSDLGTLLGTFTGTGGTVTGKTVVQLADDNHAVVVSGVLATECAEIPDVVNGPYADKMVDLSVLSPYAITAYDREQGGVPSVVVLVPLNVAPDDTGGGKSAFQSHMVYWIDGNSAWLEPQQMRIVWLVQMLTDACSPDVQSYEEYEAEYRTEHPDAEDPEISDAYNGYFDAYCAANRTVDRIVPVQVYDEDWTLAGLSVREDHGLDVAVAYTDPAAPTYDDALWTLSWGLGQQFIPQLDCETAGTSSNGDPAVCLPDGKRDLTVFMQAPATDHSVRDIGNSTIEQRFDLTTTVPITDRWGIEGDPFPLRVESFRYEDQDYLAFLGRTETPRILAQYSQTVTPTLLFAREERYRLAGMEAITGTASAGLALDLSPQAYPQQTLVGLHWAPFRYDGDASEWQAYPPADYWDALGEELEARFYELYPDDLAESNLGRVAVARGYEFALINGVVNTVRCTPDEPLCQVGSYSNASDEMLLKALKDMLNGLNVVVKNIVVDLIKNLDTVNARLTADNLFGELGKAMQNQRTLKGLSSSNITGVVGGILGAAAAIVIVTTILVAIGMGAEGLQSAAVVIRGASLAIATHCAIYTIVGQWKTFTNQQEKSFLKFSWSRMGWNVKFDKALATGALSCAVTIAITWGAFVAQFYIADMEWGSMATDSAFATAIADMIVAVLLFVIITALGPIGAIANAIIGMINAITNAICSALPEEMQKGTAGTWLCRGVTGLLSNLIKWFFYSGKILVDMDPDEYDRLSLHDFDTHLVDEEAGVVEGNQMRYSVGLTNTIDLTSVPINLYSLTYELAGSQFTTENLSRSNFSYRWQTEEKDFHDELDLRGVYGGPWNRTDGGRPLYLLQNVQSGGIPLPQVGINQPVEGLYFSEAYAVPEQECWPFVGCSIEPERSTSHFDMGADLIYDVLPATLDGFHQLVHKGDGWALAWAQDGDLTFPTLYDADGDGLSWADDPDDSRWDADADGLSDVYELNTGSDPLRPDTDDDGLTDHQEAQFGSEPARADSDGDGLLDCQEVFHEIETVGGAIAQDACGDEPGAWSGGWTIVYGMDAGQQLSTLVTASPVRGDTEGDGLNDRQELVYGYNPRVVSDLNVLSLSSALSEGLEGVDGPTDGFVAPDQTLYYSATVENKLNNRQAEGLLWTEASPALDTAGLAPQAFNLWPEAQVHMAGNLDVAAGAASGTYSVTQVAGALIADLGAESDHAALWLRFDDPPGATVFVDDSGSVPTHDGTCVGTGCTLDPAAGKTGGALSLDGSGYVHSAATVPQTGFAVSLWFKGSTTGPLYQLRSDSGWLAALEVQDGKVRANIALKYNPSLGLYISEGIEASLDLRDGQWHHLVHAVGAVPGADPTAQSLYVNGALVATGAVKGLMAPASGGIDLGRTSWIWGTSYLVGSLDDVRLFDHALTGTEARALANLPLFHMDFDQTDRWAEVSSFETTVEQDCLQAQACPYLGTDGESRCYPPFYPEGYWPLCTAYSAPTYDSETAVHGSAASFDGSVHLSVPAAQHLDLSGGRLTLAAWVYPRLHGDDRDDFPQAILGLKSGTGSAYPTLQRVGQKIRLGVGDGTQYISYTSSIDVLAANQWNHVAVTLNKDEDGGTVRIYVNGDLKESGLLGVTAVAPTTGFEIGRSSNTGRLEVTEFYSSGGSDDHYQHCWDHTYCCPEMCMAMGGGEVLDWVLTQDDHNDYSGVPFGLNFSGSATLQLWDDDEDPHCGPRPDPVDTGGNDDDVCTLIDNDFGAKMLGFSTTQVGYTTTIDFDDCDNWGYFDLTFSHDSIPFHGNMDELWIYGQALSPDDIRRVYLDVVTDLHLPLDEAPGATAFQDLSIARVPASCAGGACPTSGTPGRRNQAALFHGSQQDAITLAHSQANEGTTSFTVAAWIRLVSSHSGAQSIVSTSRMQTDDGWGFGLSGGDLVFDAYGYGSSSTVGLMIHAGRWYHVAAVVNEDDTVTFYLDGERVESAGHEGLYGSSADTDDPLLVGASRLHGAEYLSDLFDGQIDDVWIFDAALPAARIADLYEIAPALHLRFDEAHGATQFADNAADDRFATCSGTGCPLTGEQVRGQMGLAAEFDGVDDTVAIEDFGAFTQTTVSAWVYRTGETAARETIVSYKENSACGFSLALAGEQVPQFDINVGGGWQSVTDDSAIRIPLNQWVHLAGTYDGRTIRLYRNGLQVTALDAPGSMTQCTATTAIGSRNTADMHWFPGAIDQVRVYGRPLTAIQIRDQYLYESAWFEDRESRDLTVDGDDPTAAVLMAPGSYLANQEIVVGVKAADPTSGVGDVELGVQPGSQDVAWTPAPRCTDTAGQPEGAWCGRFAPSGEGDYNLYARATDHVGHTALSSAPVPVHVDDTPPALFLDQADYELLSGEASKDKSETWIVHLSGAVKDPGTVAGIISGSGVPTDGVHITLRDGKGKPLGEVGQTAFVSDGLWSLDYKLRKAKPDGCYLVEVQAEDRVARLPGLSAEQVARHTTVVTRWITLNASAPRVLLDQQGELAGGELGPGVTMLQGETTHRPVPVEVDLATAAGADQTGIRLTCQHGNEGSWYTLFDLEPGVLSADTTREWEGEIHHWSTCRVELATSAPSGGVGGVVKVCGTEIASWTADFAGSRTVEFVVHSDSCVASDCPADPEVAGVQGVDLAFRAVLPGSAFVNELPPADEILHLPFEDTPDSNGNLVVRDVSGIAPDGACSGDTCPIPGQASPSGSGALFDGVNDALRVAQVAGQGTTDSLTIAAWVYPNSAATDPFNRGTFISRYGLWVVACLRDGTIRWSFNNTDPGWVWHNTGYKAPLKQWTHIVVVYDAGEIRTYANGVLTDTYHGSGTVSNANVLDIGGWPRFGEFFAGSLDEVRLFTRALTVEEIRALYSGSGPLLTLPFEEPWATGGANLADASDWAHDVTLHTGTGDAANKAVPGQVGNYALSLDGVDDGVNAGAEIDLANSSFSAAFWAKRNATGRWDVAVSQGTPGSSTMLHIGFRPSNAFTCAFYANDLNTPTAYTDTDWHHWACTYDAATNARTIYRDGVQVAQGTASADYSGSGNLYVGSYGGTEYHFGGLMGEVRVYPRALPAPEVADLYRAGWQAATLAESGDSVERTTWTVAVPDGLEGSYQVEMRGRDAVGHVEAVDEPSLLWRGEADNLPPRLTVTRTPVDATTYHYTTVAEDYHLAEMNFTSPCGPGVATTREYFRSPWYLGRSRDTQKLYRLAAECTIPRASVEQATACDSFGNCITCDTSGNCTVAALAAATTSLHAYQVSATAPSAKPGPAGFEISAPEVVTTSQYYEPRTIDVAGLVTTQRKPGTGEHDLTSVQVAIAGDAGPAILSEPDAQRPYTITWTFPWHLPMGFALPDGVSYTAAITATDLAGRTTAVTHTLTADVVPPAPVTPTLTANGLPIQAGATIREAPADLALTWTPSSDGSGLGPYQVTWRFQDAYTTTMETSLHDPDGPREALATAGEAQRVSVGLTSRDLLGNERWQPFGPVIVDGPLTPDYIALSPGAEGDILGSECTLLGTDRRIAGSEADGRWAPQRLYGTWDHQALRLAWTGANWSGDGDLFIYLDTGPGGTTETFAPYPVVSGTLVILQPGFEADALIWVQDTDTASLLSWDGSAWAVETSLSPEQYRFEGGLDGGQTHLYLPFELLGITAGAPLGLLAFAAEEPAPDVGLRIWATMPLANPANSSRVNSRRVMALPGSTLHMSHAYRWAALSDGVCPNGTDGALLAEHHNDAWLELAAESNVPAAVVSGAARGLFWVGDPMTTLEMIRDEVNFGLLNPTQSPLPDGQEISYSVHYRNTGSHTLVGAWLDLSAFGPVQLSLDSMDLGDVPPGGEGSFTFQATVDRSLSPLAAAVVLGRLYAATIAHDGPALEWQAAVYRIDTGAPQEMGLHRPALVVGPDMGWLRGLAHDESGVSHVELEIVAPAGTTSTMICELADRASGEWSCAWDATASNGGIRPADGDEFLVRLRATDRWGQTSPWSLPHVVQVDAQPPTLTLAEAAASHPDGLVRGNSLRLVGDAQDGDAVARVTVCLDDGTCQDADLSSPGASASRWSTSMMAPGVLDFVTRTLTIRATDRLGNSSEEPKVLPVVFDNVAPSLFASQVLVQVPLASTETVLNGEAGDGGPEVNVSVRVEPPQGDVTRLPAARDGSGWWFDLPANTPGRYALWVEAEDLAGNATTAGPFTVDVTCTDATPVVTSLTTEPVAGWPLSLTLTAVLANHGPDPLPAGMMLGFHDGITYTGQVTATLSLASGGSEALSLVWAPDGTKDYDMGVSVVPSPDLPNGPLCVAPPTAHFVLPLRDQALYYGWNLISPRVSPGNSDVEVVQRGIDGDYTSILGYDGDLLAFYPDRPAESTLSTVDALHGYWIRTVLTATVPPSITLVSDESVASWRMAGEILPEDDPMSLASGWNLISYLPRRPLTVTTALESIAGQYDAVLGFERTALSYYPDLDPSYNTLAGMAPGYGYWIRATEAAILAYPETGTTNTLPIATTRMARERRRAIRLAEWFAGVQPTYEWMNYYGELTLPDGTAVPTGTVILAVDPEGAICGATSVWEPGQFGLLACYRDDLETVVDEGALPGDVIQLFLSSDGTKPDGQFLGAGVWTGHGNRWEVTEGALPLTDLAIMKAVVPEAALPGETITYTLVYTNASNHVAQGVVISDPLPVELQATGHSSSGAALTPVTGSDTFAWQVEDLHPGQGGVITVTAVLSPALTTAMVLTNTAMITAPLEGWPEDNVTEAVLQVILSPPYRWKIWLPVIMRGEP